MNLVKIHIRIPGRISFYIKFRKCKLPCLPGDGNLGRAGANGNSESNGHVHYHTLVIVPLCTPM